MTAISLDRRTLIRSAAWGCGGLALSAALPAWARSGTPGLAAPMATVSGEDIALSIGHAMIDIGGRQGHAIGINGATPGPVIRLKEGQNVRLAVTNTLGEDGSIHWHGVLLPFQMDGVPGVSFPGIKPGATYPYQFPVRQSGTYWYHSHSGMQEAMGLYGAIVIDPAGPDPVAYDREHVILLADWSFMHPHTILKKLKAQGGYFNMQKQTLASRLAGKEMSATDRRMWAGMRMDPTDISDVTGSTYHYLVNGHDSGANWTGLFTPGERVRLRIINASAMTNFNIRIPGLPMTVVAADGQNVQPVETDEFQIAIAETYDVIVQPSADQAYGFIAEAIDRSGQVRATLAPRLGMIAPIRQIILNLVGNALKFTHQGEVTVSVQSIQIAERDQILIEVKDTGIGIPADRLVHVFGTFTQADETTARRYGGTGLGLPISARLAELLGGALTVESEAGVGSKFSLRLPLEQATESAKYAPLPHQHDAALGEGGLRVLVAEDNTINQQLTLAMVSKAGRSGRAARYATVRADRAHYA